MGETVSTRAPRALFAIAVLASPLTAAEPVIVDAPPGAEASSTTPTRGHPPGHAHHESVLGLGPLRLSSQSPGQSLRLGLIPHTPADLHADEWKIYAGSSWVNVWADEADYALDYEAITTEVLVSYGIDDTWAVEVGALNRVTFGGRMDAMIQGFHSAFDLSQNGRKDVPLNQTMIRIDPTGTQPGLLLGDEELQNNYQTFVRGSLLWTLVHGHDTWPAISLAVTLQAPIGERSGYDGGLIDVSLDLSLAKAIGDWVGYGSVAWTRFAADEVYGLDLYRSNWAGLGAIEYRLTRDWSVVLQYLVSQGVAPDLYVFSKASHELTLGTQVRVGNHTTLQLGLIENLFIFENSPDFGVHLALEMRL
jgi:hypothetical protein